MYTCKYCGKEFETKEQLGGHSTYCEKNPKKLVNLEILANSHKNINYTKNTIKNIFVNFAIKKFQMPGV